MYMYMYSDTKFPCVCMFYYRYTCVCRRMLLSHFMKRVPPSIGGHKHCCDNCRQRYVFLTPELSYSELLGMGFKSARS